MLINNSIAKILNKLSDEEIMEIANVEEWAIPFIRAMANGQTVQYFNVDTWYTPNEGYSFQLDPDRYRIKKPSIVINGEEINGLVRLKDADIHTIVFTVDLLRNSTYEAMGHYHHVYNRNLVYDNKESAERVLRILNNVLTGQPANAEQRSR